MGSGGGGSQTTTVDPEYNKGMLKLAQEQQGWAAEMFNMFKYGVPYDPNKKVAAGGKPLKEKVWVPEERVRNPRYRPSGQWRGEAGSWDDPTAGLQQTQEPEYLTIPGHHKTVRRKPTTTLGEVKGYNPDEVTSEMEYLQNLVEAKQSLLGLQTEAQRNRLNLYNTYVGDINKGIDVNARMNQAQAGVQHGFKNAGRALRMDIASYGLDPGSGRYAGLRREQALAEAKGIAGARTAAKNLAEQEDFQRKTTGLSIQ